MRKLLLPVAALLLLGGRALAGVPAQEQEDAKSKAANWIMQADSTAALVETVLAGAIEAGAEEHPVAKDNVNDARRWMDEGMKALEKAKEAYDAGDYKKAGDMGNMAWQYYVKAGSAAVRATQLVGGGARR